jgi:CheY-like chemotaxis protein/anti-sigma regulatory factor (Ser/Thr protein kinase)
MVLVVDDSAIDRRLVGGLLGKGSDWQIQYAADGAEALEHVEKLLPDLIVTDLHMPRMDGLELVRAMREHHAQVPVILMTAYGSEAFAVEALEQGAASYVPKSQLADKLCETVREILARASAHQSYEKLLSRLNRSEFTFFVELGNDASLIDPMVDLVQQTVARARLCDSSGQLRIGVALREALLNALLHGNLEISLEHMDDAREQLLRQSDVPMRPDRPNHRAFDDRRIFVNVRISTDEARFVIRDEGRGFDVSAVPSSWEPGGLEQQGSRSLSLIRAFMDEVIYNEAGNEVTLIKRREKTEEPPEGIDV